MNTSINGDPASLAKHGRDSTPPFPRRLGFTLTGLGKHAALTEIRNSQPYLDVCEYLSTGMHLCQGDRRRRNPKVEDESRVQREFREWASRLDLAIALPFKGKGVQRGSR